MLRILAVIATIDAPHPKALTWDIGAEKFCMEDAGAMREDRSYSTEAGAVTPHGSWRNSSTTNLISETQLGPLVAGLELLELPPGEWRTGEDGVLTHNGQPVGRRPARSATLPQGPVQARIRVVRDADGQIWRLFGLPEEKRVTRDAQPSLGIDARQGRGTEATVSTGPDTNQALRSLRSLRDYFRGPGNETDLKAVVAPLGKGLESLQSEMRTRLDQLKLAVESRQGEYQELRDLLELRTRRVKELESLLRDNEVQVRHQLARQIKPVATIFRSVAQIPLDYSFETTAEEVLRHALAGTTLSLIEQETLRSVLIEGLRPQLLVLGDLALRDLRKVQSLLTEAGLSEGEEA